jgi:hypothetical protein
MTPERRIARWLTLVHDLPALAEELGRWGWSQPQLTPEQLQLSITGPSGIRVTLWSGLEPFACETQLRLGWLGPLGFTPSARETP